MIRIVATNYMDRKELASLPSTVRQHQQVRRYPLALLPNYANLPIEIMVRKVIRWFALVSLSSLLLLVLLFTTIWLQSVDARQQDTISDPYTFPDTLQGKRYDLDSLKSVIGHQQKLPEGFEIAAAIAYSAYPELKDARVEMVLTPDGAPMESNFDVWTLLLPWHDRQYRILLNDNPQSFFDPILLRSLPFDAQVGILAHELGHVAYYDRLNVFEIAKWGLCYLRDDEFRALHERTTDLMPVYHGLGSQIYQYAYYVRRDPSCAAFYAEDGDFMDRYYMTDTELREVLNR